MEIYVYLYCVYVRYFAQYLVVKRASVEYNLQKTYRDLLDAIGKKELKKLVLEATYHSIKVTYKTIIVCSIKLYIQVPRTKVSFLFQVSTGGD